MRSNDEIRTLVRERYGAIVREGASCCAPASCGCGPEMAPDGLNMIGDAYAGVAGHLAEADFNLGCGVPTRHAALAAGETVLDLGSGAGNDVFIARHEVGPEGRVIGVDMTPEMIVKARANASKLGYDNVEFRLGEIERMPVDAGSVDVVISNCVLNLVPDKAGAFAEMFRVLRPGGRFCVSDIVATGELPPQVQEAAGTLCRLRCRSHARGRLPRHARSGRLRARAHRRGKIRRDPRRRSCSAHGGGMRSRRFAPLASSSRASR